jgi:hypothetical protein
LPQRRAWRGAESARANRTFCCAWGAGFAEPAANEDGSAKAAEDSTSFSLQNWFGGVAEAQPD